MRSRVVKDFGFFDLQFEFWYTLRVLIIDMNTRTGAEQHAHVRKQNKIEAEHFLSVNINRVHK